jgi:hypothetical protein
MRLISGVLAEAGSQLGGVEAGVTEERGTGRVGGCMAAEAEGGTRVVEAREGRAM